LKKAKVVGGPVPVYANEFVVWLHNDAVAIEFKTKVGAEIEERVALVLMHPDKFQELLEMMMGVEDGVEGATKAPSGEKYKGVEFG
jgi:hypothetical protein